MLAPLLSLIIPTRERAQTLAHTLATALDQESRDYEVVVSDNASEDNTREVVEAFADSRVRYVNTGQRLSMCGNYEFAVEDARGAYVIIIGDDDGVLPGALDRLLGRLSALDAETIYFWPLDIYDWPADGGPGIAAHVAELQPESELDLRAKARTVMRQGGWKYYELPSPYHSAVPRAILSALRERTGKVFHSTQPDVFTAMAIPAFAQYAVNLGTPVTMHGRSPKSNGRDFTRGQRPNIRRFLAEYGDYRFHPSLFSGASAAANMIPDAILMAKDMFPELYGDVTFGYEAMWAYVCRLGFAPHWQVVRQSSDIRRAHPFRLMPFLGYSLFHQAAAIRRNILDRIQRVTRHRGPVPPNIRDFAHSLAQRDVR